MKTKSTSKYTYSVGRRRSAIAKVKLFSGKQASTVNQNIISKPQLPVVVK